MKRTKKKRNTKSANETRKSRDERQNQIKTVTMGRKIKSADDKKRNNTTVHCEGGEVGREK